MGPDAINTLTGGGVVGYFEVSLFLRGCSTAKAVFYVFMRRKSASASFHVRRDGLIEVCTHIYKLSQYG